MCGNIESVVDTRAVTPTEPNWRDLKAKFDEFRSEADMDAEWTFGGANGPGHTWRLRREGELLNKPALWELFAHAGEQLGDCREAKDLVPKRLLEEKDPLIRWLSALRYLNLNVRVLATAEWRVERGLIWDVVGASSYLCQAFASKYPRARVKRHAMHTYAANQAEIHPPA